MFEERRRGRRLDVKRVMGREKLLEEWGGGWREINTSALVQIMQQDSTQISKWVDSYSFFPHSSWVHTHISRKTQKKWRTLNHRRLPGYHSSLWGIAQHIPREVGFHPFLLKTRPVTPGKSINKSMPQCPHLQTGMIFFPFFFFFWIVILSNTFGTLSFIFLE